MSYLHRTPDKSFVRGNLASQVLGHQPEHRQGRVHLHHRPPGCGKSTVLNIVAGLLDPSPAA